MNRHLFGDTLPVAAVVPDCVKVNAGDLMLLFGGSGESRPLNVDLRAASGGSGYAYPFAAGCTSGNIGGVTYPFLGIALNDSPKGSTDTISVAQAGVFEMVLVARAGVTLGKVVNSVAPTGFSRSAQTTASYRVYQDSGGGASIGYCYKTEASARTVRVLIRTKFGPGGIVENA